MDRLVRALTACFAVVAGAQALAVLPGPAAGATTPCAQRVLQDWSDNGRVDGVYELHCYEEAIEALPSDLRDYTDAADVIDRALTSALRSSPPMDGGGTASSPDAAPIDRPAMASSMPVAPLLAGGIALAVLLAGGLAYVARRHKAA